MQGTTFKIKYNRDYNEWVVVTRINGVVVEDACYYALDKQDAEDTMKELEARAKKFMYIVVADGCAITSMMKDKEVAKAFMSTAINKGKWNDIKLVAVDPFGGRTTINV